jgi:eukaryotic-like serine/threonine-protein kinase
MPDSISDEQWASILRVARAALEHPAESRLIFIRAELPDERSAEEAVKVVQELENPEPDDPGDVRTNIGRFQLLDYLGSGGFGEVYSAMDPDLLRNVAIKILRPEAYAVREQEQRFIREARIISALNHPNIVTIHEIVRTEDNLAIVMELISGETLRRAYARGLVMPEILDIGSQVATGLAVAHVAGVTHRDIKPENIMVLPDRRVKLLDFGLAKSPDPNIDAKTSLRSSFAGTPQYMSPEHFRSEPISAKSDVFALGLVLYEACTGSHPFPASSPFEILHAIATKEPAPPSELNPSVTPQVQHLILSMMSKDPGDRPAAAEVRDELKRIRELSAGTVLLNIARGQPTLVIRQSEQRGPMSHRSVSPKRVLQIVVAVAAAALILLIVRWHPHGTKARVFLLAGNAGLETSPSFSPDSKQVAYSWDGNRRNFDIYVKPVEGGYPHRLTDNAGHDLDPAWSPDGKQIAFLRVLPQKNEVVIIPSTGGIEQVLELPEPIARWAPEGPYGSEVAGPTAGPIWSADGKYFVVPRTHDPGGLEKLFLDGRREYLTRAPSGMYDIGASLSPKGDFVAFKRVWASNSSDLFVVPVDGGNPVRLTTQSHDVQGIDWLNRNHLLFSSNAAGAYQLWQIRRSGDDLRVFTVAGSHPQQPALSPDGRWLAFVEPTVNASIWRATVKDSVNELFQPEPFISSAGQDYSPDYSPDGKKIVFISDRSGAPQLWTSDSDGSDVKQLIDFRGSSAGSPHWSPDSSRIVFDGVMDGQSAIWLVNADGGSLHHLNSSSVRQYMPTWSRDGHWVYYLSLTPTGDHLFKQNPETGQLIDVVGAALVDAHEDENGQAIYTQGSDHKLRKFSSTGAVPSAIPQLTNQTVPRYWTLSHGIIFFVADEHGSHILESFNVRTRALRKLGVIPNELLPGTAGLSVHPSGHYILFVQRDQRRSSIVVQER